MLSQAARHLRQPLTQHAVFLRRWKTNWLGALLTASGHAPCVIEDISAAGAKLDLDRAPAEGSCVSLVLAEGGTIPARVAWRVGDQIGLQFSEKQPWVLDLVAKAVEANADDPLGYR